MNRSLHAGSLGSPEEDVEVALRHHDTAFRVHPVRWHDQGLHHLSQHSSVGAEVCENGVEDHWRESNFILVVALAGERDLPSVDRIHPLQRHVRVVGSDSYVQRASSIDDRVLAQGVDAMVLRSGPAPCTSTLIWRASALWDLAHEDPQIILRSPRRLTVNVWRAHTLISLWQGEGHVGIASLHGRKKCGWQHNAGIQDVRVVPHIRALISIPIELNEFAHTNALIRHLVQVVSTGFCIMWLGVIRLGDLCCQPS
mmetsp:Transcript_70470/g.165277  ORF Transcript_70470/g.165277 Transcript_70470/m.165277 type:complete len:255 (+) Transcript_70470:630-1394(+)